MQALGATRGSRRDFFLVCPLASAALGWCRVLEDRWVLPHHSVRSSFLMGRWSAKFCQSVSYSVIWPAAWVSAVDKTLSSKSAGVRRIWKCMMNARRLFILFFYEKYALFSWLETSPWLGMFGLSL